MIDLLSELSDPPKADPEALRIVALGGLGEVGRNMTVFEYRGKILVIDCGVLFPEEEQPGIDLILPDFSYLEGREDDVVGIVLTHGHEDHIGAVPYLLKKLGDVPILGSTLTLALVEAKLKEHRIRATTRIVAEDDKDQLGRSTSSLWPSTTRFQTRSPCVCARVQEPFCTPVTSRWTSCHLTAVSPTCGRSRVWVKKAWTCSSPTPRTPMFPVSPPWRKTSGLFLKRSLVVLSDASLWRPSPLTSTASSRC